MPFAAADYRAGWTTGDRCRDRLGVLAIAAAKLGAASVVALDEDPEALRNARENVARNDVAASVDVREADLASFQCEPAGVVVANLTGAVIQRHAGRLSRLVEAGRRKPHRERVRRRGSRRHCARVRAHR